MDVSTPQLLWPEGAPGAFGDQPQDKPALVTCRPPAGRSNGASMLVLPGGGYGGITAHEGLDYAAWLVEQGITCHVLTYRLGSNGYRHPCMLQDASRALRIARLFARQNNLDLARIGVIGSSAGGHLASTLLTHFDSGAPDAADPIERESSRPDLGILCYAVITLVSEGFIEPGSCRRLIGENPPLELSRHLSSELQVTAQTPPCFLWHALTDGIVKVENSLMFASALRKAGVPFDLHIYDTGGHGVGLGRSGVAAPPWADACVYWLRVRKFL